MQLGPRHAGTGGVAPRVDRHDRAVAALERLHPRPARRATGQITRIEPVVGRAVGDHRLLAVPELRILGVRVAEGGRRRAGRRCGEAHIERSDGRVESIARRVARQGRTAVRTRVGHDVVAVVPWDVVGERASGPVDVDHAVIGRPAAEGVVVAVRVGAIGAAVVLAGNEDRIRGERLGNVVVDAVGGGQDDRAAGRAVGDRGPRADVVGTGHREQDATRRLLDLSTCGPTLVDDRAVGATSTDRELHRAAGQRHRAATARTVVANRDVPVPLAGAEALQVGLPVGATDIRHPEALVAAP